MVGAPGVVALLRAWAIITTGVGFALRGRWQVAAMAGLLTQLGLVLGFALSQSLFAGGPLATQSLVTYVVVALVAGPFFAAAAGFLRDPCVVTRTLGLVTVSAPWVVDGVRMMGSALDQDPQVAARLVVGAGLLAVGIALPLMINGSPRDSLRNLGVAAGLGVFIVVALCALPERRRAGRAGSAPTADRPALEQCCAWCPNGSRSMKLGLHRVHTLPSGNRCRRLARRS